MLKAHILRCVLVARLSFTDTEVRGVFPFYILKPWLIIQESNFASELQAFKGGVPPLLQDQVSPVRGHHPPPTSQRSPRIQSQDHRTTHL